MPISPLLVAKRHTEIGRIRLGQKNPDRGFPMKLSHFRFTSPTERYITDLASLYGGTPQKWDNNGKPEFEVFTDATSLPVYVVRGGLSQWMETWSGGGLVHRCDGERQADGTPCDPDEWIEVKERGKPKRLYVHKEAKPTTRLSVMLPELEAVGTWRMESKGWNAAAEIPAVAELAQMVGEVVPAVLHLVERRTVKDGQTSRFIVPVLDLQVGMHRLRELVAEKAGIAIEASPAGTAAIEAPGAEAARQEAPAQSATAPQVKIPTPEQVAAMDAETAAKAVAYLEAHGAADHPATAAVRARLASLSSSPAMHDGTGPSTAPVAAETVEAEIVEEPPGWNTTTAAAEADADVIWQQILKVGGQLGMTLLQIQDDCTGRLGGVSHFEATGAELQMYLNHLQATAAGEAGAA